MASELLSSSLGAIDMMWAHTCRAQDMAHRKIENRRRAIDDARRILDNKVQQLKAISHLAALVAGFCMVVLVEAQVDENAPSWLKAAFGLSAASVIGLMCMAMINCTLILVLILKHDCTRFVDDLTPSELLLDFWSNRCEDDWQTSFQAFTAGVPAFLVSLALLGWVKFLSSPATAVCITVVAVIAIGVWILHTQRKWGSSTATTELRQRSLSMGGSALDDGTGETDGSIASPERTPATYPGPLTSTDSYDGRVGFSPDAHNQV